MTLEPLSYIVVNTLSGRKVTVGNVNRWEVSESLTSLTDTASVYLPRRMYKDEKSVDQYITRGDSIELYAGYGDPARDVFQGYVSRVDVNEANIVIQCENEAYTIKGIAVAPKLYKSTTLKALLADIMPGISVKSADMNLGEVRIAEKTTASKVIDYITRNYPVDFTFLDGVLLALLPLTSTIEAQRTIKVKKDFNIVKASISEQVDKDKELQIVSKAILADNTKIEAKFPATAENADIRTFYVPGAASVADLKKHAEEMHKRYIQRQAEGEIVMFGLEETWTRKGDIVHYYDDDNAQLNDRKWLARDVTRVMGNEGYRCTVKIGAKVA
jgi:hypothetical protein